MMLLIIIIYDDDDDDDDDDDVSNEASYASSVFLSSTPEICIWNSALPYFTCAKRTRPFGVGGEEVFLLAPVSYLCAAVPTLNIQTVLQIKLWHVYVRQD